MFGTCRVVLISGVVKKKKKKTRMYGIGTKQTVLEYVCLEIVNLQTNISAAVVHQYNQPGMHFLQ